MFCDYKFWYIKRDDGFITECAVRFYEGDYEVALDKNGKPVQKYVRSKKYGKKDLDDLKDRFIEDFNSESAFIYKVIDFGAIKTDEELINFLNSQLDIISKSKQRDAINEQKWLV